ncbi:MAG TPA: hypothetical protein VK009_16870 [Chloroflexota bacterium]|nr:hypothetical protein [Chloroflexota bacterium]
MPETYDSVVDRIGAFNAATEAMSKGRAKEVLVEIAGQPHLRLRLVRTEDNYAIEVHGAAVSPALAEMGFAQQGEDFGREVRKSERSWNVASQLEDVLQDALNLGPDVAVSITTT